MRWQNDPSAGPPWLQASCLDAGWQRCSGTEVCDSSKLTDDANWCVASSALCFCTKCCTLPYPLWWQLCACCICDVPLTSSRACSGRCGHACGPAAFCSKGECESCPSGAASGQSAGCGNEWLVPVCQAARLPSSTTLSFCLGGCCNRCRCTSTCAHQQRLLLWLAQAAAAFG